MAAGFAVWLAALWLVIRSPKFLRKWLWGLLCFASFSFSWSVGPGAMFSLGIPFGALYVLWFWRFGPIPTPEELAKAAERLANRPGPVADSWRVTTLRVAYAIAAIVSAALGTFFATGGGAKLMIAMMPSGEGARMFDSSTMAAMSIGQGLMMAALVGVLVLLAIKPYWWGKLLCAWAGLAWSGFGLIMTVFAGYDPRSTLILVAGVTMMVVAVVHQFVDPRFSGSYLRAS
jgi:hypothetical protein